MKWGRQKIMKPQKKHQDMTSICNFFAFIFYFIMFDFVIFNNFLVTTKLKNLFLFSRKTLEITFNRCLHKLFVLGLLFFCVQKVTPSVFSFLFGFHPTLYLTIVNNNTQTLQLIQLCFHLYLTFLMQSAISMKTLSFLFILKVQETFVPQTSK